MEATQCQLWTFSPFVMIYKQSLQVDDGKNLSRKPGGAGCGGGRSSAFIWIYLNLGTSGHTRRNLHDASVFIRINRGCGQGCNLPEKAQAKMTQSRRSVKHRKNQWIEVSVFDRFCCEKSGAETRYPAWRAKGSVTTLLLESLHIWCQILGLQTLHFTEFTLKAHRYFNAYRDNILN